MTDTLTILISFSLGIFMIWIKEALSKRIAVASKRQALRSLCLVVLDSIRPQLRYLEDAATRKVSLYDHFHPPVPMMELILDLIRIDTRNVGSYDLMYGNLLVSQQLFDAIHDGVKAGDTESLDDLYEKMEYRLMCVASCCAAFIDGEKFRVPTDDPADRAVLRQLKQKYANTEDSRFKELE